MKLEKERNVIEQNGLTDSGEFTIESNAHAFQILSSGVYTNKLRAPIRELCCNAFDAHTANGNTEKAIEISLPTPKNTSFSVRDFGPGLTKEDVETIYTTYFKSTRNTSNEYTGGFGIGSKSPFAVVKSFEIESRVGSLATTYEAFLDKDGMPHIRVIKESPTTEASGLTITMKVPKDEVTAFNGQAADVFRAFESPYKILNTPGNFESDEPWLSLNGETIGKTLWLSAGDHENHWGRGRNRGVDQKIIMGNICYSLATYTNKIDEGKDLLVDWFMKQSLVMRIPVGAVSVAASREDLSYDKKTLQALPSLIHEEIALFAQNLYKQAQKASTKYACAEKLRELCRQNGVLSRNPELLDFMSKAGGWPDEITLFLKEGLSSILPKGIQVASVHPILANTELIFSKINSRLGQPSSGRKKVRNEPALPPMVRNIDDLLDHLEGHAKRQGLSDGYMGHAEMLFVREVMELGLPPFMMELLAKPLRPYVGLTHAHYRERGDKEEVVAVPSHRLKTLIADDKTAHSRNHFGRPAVRSTTVVDREALKILVGALDKTNTPAAKTRGRPPRYGNDAMIVALFPDATISPKAFGDLITQVNKDWGTTFEVGAEDLSADVPVIEQAVPVEPVLVGYEGWNGKAGEEFLYNHYQHWMRGKEVNLLKDDAPYLYVEDNLQLNLGSYQQEAIKLFAELGAPHRILVLDSSTIKGLAEAGKTNGRSFEDFVKNDVLPWAALHGMSHSGRNHHDTMVSDSLHKLFEKLANHPEGASLPVVQSRDKTRPPEIDWRMERLVLGLLERCDLRLPKRVDPFVELRNSYPFLNLSAMRESKDLSYVVDYIRAVDAKRSMDNNLANGPQD